MQVPQNNLSVAMKTIGRPNMIRIETTAEFDEVGRFVLVGQTDQKVVPGKHCVVVLVTDAAVSATLELPEFTSDSCLHVDGEKLLLDVPLNSEADHSVVHGIESARQQRDENVLGARLTDQAGSLRRF